MAQLNARDGALSLKKTGDTAKRRCLCVVPKAKVAMRAAALFSNGGRLGKDQPGAAHGEPAQMHQMPVIRDAVPGAILAHRRYRDAVAESDRFQSIGREQL